MQVREKNKLDKKKKAQISKKKRSNTNLVLVQAKLQYLPSIGADLSLKECLVSD